MNHNMNSTDTAKKIYVLRDNSNEKMYALSSLARSTTTHVLNGNKYNCGRGREIIFVTYFFVVLNF